MQTKKIIVLANSFRNHGRCIAGRDQLNGNWVRPISTSGEGEILATHCQLESKDPIQLLDIIQINFQIQRSGPGQPENWEIKHDTNTPWKRIGKLDLVDIHKMIECPDHLWNYEPNKSDRTSVEIINKISDLQSLYLIKPKNLVFRTFFQTSLSGYTRIRTCGQFNYSNINYALWLTDDFFIEKYIKKPVERNEIVVTPSQGDSVALCISLSAPLNGFHYKLIAGVIPLHNESSPQETALDNNIPF